MVVPAGGMEPGYGDGSGMYSARPGRARGYREPFLQRWLFSRRILVVLAVLVIAAATWWVTAGQYFSLPRVTGMTVSTARADLANAGLTAKVGAAEHSDSVPAGQVILTEPGSGAHVKHGQLITLIPSLGPVEVSVPNVTGQGLTAAEQMLESAGLTAAPPTYETSTTVSAGVVIATNPPAYSNTPKDKPVGLVVSSGPPLPSFLGELFTAAQGQAGSVGVTLQEQSAGPNNAPAGTILRQSPPPGSPVKAGEVVTVWVSPGPPQVPVPDVDGLNQQQATQELQAAGFQVSVNNTFGGVLGNKVTSYSPTGQAPKGSTITINIGL
jgi:serine/threonine-protein kinase